MKAMFGVGVLILVLGVLSVFVPIPSRERNDLKIGDVSVGITTQHNEKVSPIVSAVMIVGGVGMLIAARSQKA